MRNQFQCQTGRKRTYGKRVDGDEWVIRGMDHQAGDLDLGDQRPRAAPGVIVGRRPAKPLRGAV